LTERLSIAQVTPYPWETSHPVNRQVAGLSAELARRGHRVVVVAPSRASALVRQSRRAIRAARARPDDLFEPGGVPRVLGVGEVLELPASRRRAARLPIDVARTVEEVLSLDALDVLHAHEPFAPSTASAALRHSRALNVGTFHAPTERILSTQLARRVVGLLLGRLDARVASYEATRDLMQSFFPASYDVIRPAVGDLSPPRAKKHPGERVEIAFTDQEERSALRLLLRALRRLPAELEWRATLISAREIPAAPGVADRIRRVDPDDPLAADVLAGADIAVSASSGAAPAPDAVLRAIAGGAIPLAARLPVYEELLADGAHGLLFEPGDVETLAAQLARLGSDSELRERLARSADSVRDTLTFSRLADECEGVYASLVARRRDGGDPALRAKLRRRRLIDVDLHMHTDHSPDCATPVEVLLAEAKAKGLGAIAITDHNEVSGAHEARAKTDGALKVIVAEEIKTADQGEVIGLFIEDKIPRGMTLAETIAAIRRQGGVVYFPHPFDRLHSVPDYEHLLDVIDDIDALEVFNPRVAISEFNDEAVRFAAKYRIPAGAGSDAHVAQGLGSVRIRMRDFNGPEEFLESLREADIIRRPASLLYVQALKFLQTKATPPPARPAVRARRVRRATRKS
jgi:glycosyltransferase involved in cell wall biosynthesis